MCQEDPYLLELVRDIHLNPLRAGIVEELKLLDTYPYCGQCALMGKGESRMKGDERMLGQGDFVETVLKAPRKNLDRKSMIRALGYDFE